MQAGVGVNNIPIDRCSEAGVAVFSTPGANANAVKELVLCAMLMSSRDVDGSIQWVREQVKAGRGGLHGGGKGKIRVCRSGAVSKDAGDYWLGCHRFLVANMAIALGMDVYGYDPYLSVNAALRLDRPVPCGTGYPRSCTSVRTILRSTFTIHLRPNR